MSSQTVRTGVMSAAGLAVGLLLGVLAIAGVAVLMQRLVWIIPTDMVDGETWYNRFSFWAYINVAIVLCLALVWHVMAYRHAGRPADRRGLWIILLLLSLASGIGLGFLFYRAIGLWRAHTLNVLIGLLVFWAATMFSPNAHKYAPLASRWFRR